MSAMRVFQIALIDRVYPAVAYFDSATKNTITYTLWEHLVALAKATPGSFMPGPSWSLRAAHLQAHDVVVYFVLDPSQSVSRKKFEVAPPANANGGFTLTTSKGVVSEVYVEGNMPARRLANIAFHEMMHNKLKMGDEMHVKGGLGLAQKTSEQWTVLSMDNIRLMSANLFRAVPQYTGSMLESYKGEADL